jgi:hypothetical protein
MPLATCYACEAGATSDEHVPPKCLFPERKDVPDGTDYRVNLITVPSCEVHNSAKSRDDEYLLQTLAGSYTSSQVGLTQFLTKVRRAFERTPSKSSSLIQRSVPVMLKREAASEWEQGAEVIVEAERLDNVLGNCARALYFHETGKKFAGPVHVITAFTMYKHALVQEHVSREVRAATEYFCSRPPNGANPVVFWYKFEESENAAVFLMCFYGSSEVLIRFEKHSYTAGEP